MKVLGRNPARTQSRSNISNNPDRRQNMKYQLKDFNRNIPDEDLLADLMVVAERLCQTSISSREYNDSGAKYTSGTIAARFGSWNNGKYSTKDTYAETV